MPSQRLWSTSHRATFIRFAGVASTIAGIDILILYLLHHAGGLNVYVARIFSYGTAMTASYFLNNRYTFHNHQRTRHIAAELSRFYVVFGIGGLINYGVFATIIAAGDAVGAEPAVRLWLPLLGIWMGGIGGMAFNYGVSHKLVFHNQ